MLRPWQRGLWGYGRSRRASLCNSFRICSIPKVTFSSLCPWGCPGTMVAGVLAGTFSWAQCSWQWQAVAAQPAVAAWLSSRAEAGPAQPLGQRGEGDRSLLLVEVLAHLSRRSLFCLIAAGS